MVENVNGKEKETFDPKDFIPKLDDGDIKGYMERSEYYPMFLDSMREVEPIMLIGEAGTGKTSMVRYFCAKNELPLLHFSCDNISEFGEYIGYQGLKDGDTFFREGALIKLACNMPCVIIMDEASMMDPGKFGRLQVFIENRIFFVREADNGQGKYYKLHPEARIVLAGNPPTGMYNGTCKFNAALLRRLRIIEMEDFKPAELEKIFEGRSRIKEVLKYYSEIRDSIKQQGLRTTFSITDVKKIFNAIDRKYSIIDCLKTSYLNAVKLTAGQEVYNAFLNLTHAIFAENEVKQVATIDKIDITKLPKHVDYIKNIITNGQVIRDLKDREESITLDGIDYKNGADCAEFLNELYKTNKSYITKKSEEL